MRSLARLGTGRGPVITPHPPFRAADALEDHGLPPAALISKTGRITETVRKYLEDE